MTLAQLTYTFCTKLLRYFDNYRTKSIMTKLTKTIVTVTVEKTDVIALYIAKLAVHTI